MKSYKTYLLLMLAVVLLTGCGSDDDPVRPEVRNFELPVLYHKLQGTEASASKSSCDVTLNTTTLALTLSFNLDGATLPVSTTATRDDARGNFFTFSNVSSGRITALTGYLDLNEQSLITRFVLDGTTIVHTTLPGVYFTSTATNITSPNGSSWSIPNAIYQFDIDPRLDTVMVTFGPFTLNDRGMYFNTMRAFRGNVTVTPTGYTLTGNALVTQADYRSTADVDHTRWFRTYDFELNNFDVGIDLNESAMAGHFDIAHTLTDPDTKVVTVDYSYPTSISGKFYSD